MTRIIYRLTGLCFRCWGKGVTLHFDREWECTSWRRCPVCHDGGHIVGRATP